MKAGAPDRAQMKEPAPVTPVRPPPATASPTALPAPPSPVPAPPPPVALPTRAAAAAPVRTGGPVNASYVATETEKFYPALSKRYDEQGTVLLRVYISA